MKFLQALKKLEDSDKYNKWKKQNPDCYLAHGFLMAPSTEWQIGYFNPKSKKIVTFVISDDITINPESEIMNKKVLEINPKQIKITAEKAFEVSEKLQKKKYNQHPSLKKFIILQKSEKGQIWNITYVTKTFKTINIQVDTINGNVIYDKILEIFRFDK